MQLLFQHHTTLEKARKDGLFGYQGHNFIVRCGPNLALLDNDLQKVKHLIDLFPVPFLFARLYRSQEIAHKKRTRITFLIGGVHCCGVSRFQTREENISLPLHDSKLMYQIISSAIANRPASKNNYSCC
ncbi:unnamed protein product [Rotaria sp. Silwood2]|nr:unnamed protein product [Rotaria sp. Silwood2]CAF4245450.1 unnamed protein product [Rotaria sp. Silwood2]